MLTAAMLFLSLGLDTLAVAVGLGLSGLARAKWLRVGLVFAFFEGGMPIIGILVGKQLGGSLGQWAGYGASALLLLVGGREIQEYLTDKDDDKKDDDKNDDDDEPPSVEGAKLLLTGLSVSLDELAVGFSLGVLRVPLGPALAYIAAQAFVVTFIGLAFGVRIGKRLGERAELVAGVVLALLGLALLIHQATGSRLPL